MKDEVNQIFFTKSAQGDKLFVSLDISVESKLELKTRLEYALDLANIEQDDFNRDVCDNCDNFNEINSYIDKHIEEGMFLYCLYLPPIIFFIVFHL